MTKLSMRSASQCAPKTCTACNKRLPSPAHGRPWKDHEECWHITCKCHTVYVWGWHPKSNGCWKVRDNSPLFDTKEVVVIA